jgi:hypothetical protein
MIYLLVILGIWYITKIYYTHKFTLNLNTDDGISQICYSCGKMSYTDPSNLRNPYYCLSCS